MRSEEWKGLITNASPYVLPPGASVDQVNLQAHIPGQLTTRGGMRAVDNIVGLDLYPYMFNGTVFAITMTDTGNIHAVESPALGAPPSMPSPPALAPSSGQIQSNYAGQFYAYGGEPPQ